MLWKTAVVAFLAVVVLADETVVKQSYEERCKTNGSTVEDFKVLSRHLGDCIEGLPIDFEDIRKMTETDPFGARNKLVRLICEQSPVLKTCLGSVIEEIVPCNDPNATEDMAHLKNTANQLVDYICYNDAERYVELNTANGVECIMEKTSAIEDCYKKSQEPDDTPNTVPANCARFDDMVTCGVNALKQCSTPTPANIIEAFLKFVRTTTPCDKALPKN